MTEPIPPGYFLHYRASWDRLLILPCCIKRKNITNEQVCTESVITIHAKTYIPGLIGLAAIIKRSGYEKKCCCV